MESRSFTLIDRLIGEIDKAIKVLASPSYAARATPDHTPDHTPDAAPNVPGAATASLSDAERRESGRLMRVNHAGEVSAQALYQGQALTARSSSVALAMRRSAAEETDHLAWCRQRLEELGTRPSVLNPLWYLGSFVIGAFAGALGDRTSLGFIAETEKQVESHLSEHEGRLPVADRRSRAILEQMKKDEIEHGVRATAQGGSPLPLPIRLGMRLTSRLMTRSSYWL
jgi:ubiquinone biosynthesis monooxygenase Coq7